MTSRSYQQTGGDRPLWGRLPSSPAGAGGWGSTWHWLDISGNASNCWSPFLVTGLDWPMVLPTNYVFCFLIAKQTFLLPPPRSTSISSTVCSLRNIFSLVEFAPSFTKSKAHEHREGCYFRSILSPRCSTVSTHIGCSVVDE